MDNALFKEYKKFQEKYKEQYIKRSSRMTIFNSQDCFDNFLCYKAMLNPQDLIIELIPGHDIKEYSTNNFTDYFNDKGLNINIAWINRSIYVEAKSFAIQKYLSSPKDNQKYLIRDAFLSKDLLKIKNRLDKKEDYNKTKKLIEIIGDPGTIHLIPHNFPALNLQHDKKLIKFLLDNGQIIDCDYSLTLSDNHTTTLAKMYELLEKNKEDTYFTTEEIEWHRWNDLELKMNKILCGFEKRPEFSGRYLSEENLLEYFPISEIKITLPNNNEHSKTAMPLVMGRYEERDVEEDIIKRLEKTGVILQQKQWLKF